MYVLSEELDVEREGKRRLDAVGRMVVPFTAMKADRLGRAGRRSSFVAEKVKSYVWHISRPNIQDGKQMV